MKRLGETGDDDPLHMQARELLSAVEPLAHSEERRRRVRRGMEQKRAARRGMWRGPRALALAAVLVFGFSTLAAAQSGMLRAIIARVSSVIELPELVFSAQPKRARPASKQRVTPPVQALAQPAAPVAPVATETVPAEQAEAIEIAPSEVPEVTPALNAPAQTRRHNSRARAAEDNELVRRAVKALRRDGDAALAGRMLEEAHVRSPHGALAEEVMSLRVEAALARGDGRARKYAQEYLAKYPLGRYRTQVQGALRSGR